MSFVLSLPRLPWGALTPDWHATQWCPSLRADPDYNLQVLFDAWVGCGLVSCPLSHCPVGP